MKRAGIFLIILLFIIAESRGQKQVVDDDIIKVDITKRYSQKKELILQDFMDVEYVVLETNDDFLNQGIVKAIGKDIILVTNRISDGDIFIYDRTGKAVRKINRKGQGSEEYNYYSKIVLDEDNGEIFVFDLGKNLVYDLYGKFKRSFKPREGATNLTSYHDVFNYDKDNLICHELISEEVAFFLISKQDGSITKEIKIPVKEKESLMRAGPYIEGQGSIFYGGAVYSSIIPYNSNWVFCDISSDTMFTFLPDYSLSPFLIRTPPVKSTDPSIALIFRFFSDRYYFMETVKNEFDLDTKEGFYKTFFMYDKQEKACFNYTIYDGDYSIRREMYLNMLRPVNHEIESWQPIQAHQLVESYKKGELKGKLKEIASKLDEEDNPVIMLIKHKK